MIIDYHLFSDSSADVSERLLLPRLSSWQIGSAHQSSAAQVFIVSLNFMPSLVVTLTALPVLKEA